MLLSDKLPKRNWWHGTNMAEPEYAEDYVTEYGSWWEREERPLAFLRAVWSSEVLSRT
jgi:hypothetical protein